MKPVFIFFFCSLVLACGPYRLSQNSKPLQEKEQIVAIDLALTNLNVVKHIGRVDEQGRMTVQVELENEKNKDIWTDIQVIFRDDKGFELERSSWEPFMAHRKTVSMFEKMAMKPGAKDYRILIRNTK